MRVSTGLLSILCYLKQFSGAHSTFLNLFLLFLTAVLKLLLTAWTFGMQVCKYHRIMRFKLIFFQVPAGIFLPSITIGAVMGRAVGIIMLVAL
jgi:chloride channel 3/4/5